MKVKISLKNTELPSDIFLCFSLSRNVQCTSDFLTPQNSYKNSFFMHSLTADRRKAQLFKWIIVGGKKKKSEMILTRFWISCWENVWAGHAYKLRLLLLIHFKQGRDSTFIAQRLLWPGHSAALATWNQWASPCLVDIKILELPHSFPTVFEPRTKAVCFPTPGFLSSWTIPPQMPPLLLWLTWHTA